MAPRGWAGCVKVAGLGVGQRRQKRQPGCTKRVLGVAGTVGVGIEPCLAARLDQHGTLHVCCGKFLPRPPPARPAQLPACHERAVLFASVREGATLSECGASRLRRPRLLSRAGRACGAARALRGAERAPGSGQPAEGRGSAAWRRAPLAPQGPWRTLTAALLPSFPLNPTAPALHRPAPACRQSPRSCASRAAWCPRKPSRCGDWAGAGRQAGRDGSWRCYLRPAGRAFRSQGRPRWGSPAPAWHSFVSVAPCTLFATGPSAGNG